MHFCTVTSTCKAITVALSGISLAYGCALAPVADPATAAKVAARKELVKGKTTEDLRWLKHKAYYR